MKWLALILCGATVGCASPPEAIEERPTPEATDTLQAWTVGHWVGTRRDGEDGTVFPMEMHVRAVLGGLGQSRELAVHHDGGTYRGFAVQVAQPGESVMVRQYVNGVRGTFVRLVGSGDGQRTVWRGEPKGDRQSRLDSERLGPDHWRRTMHRSEDGGVTWRILWVDELRRESSPGSTEDETG